MNLLFFSPGNSLIRRAFLCLSFASFMVFPQDRPAGLEFSGVVNINTNGISSVPAFTLGEPALVGILSLKKGRFGMDQYIAFSLQGEPWYIESYLNYLLIDRRKFDFATSAMWGVGYSHPEVLLDGTLQTIAKAERYAFLIFTATQSLSEKISFSGSTWHGYGFPELSIRWAHFVSFVGNFTKLNISKSLYTSFFPQILYVNLDYEEDGFFVAGIIGIGHREWPFFLSTQFSQIWEGNLSPNPGFQWNIGLSFSF